MPRTKTIFISDIHMGDRRSMEDPNHYCWFKENIPHLVNFLEEQRKAADVKEVVILGDLFDTWIIPDDCDPLTSFHSICSSDENNENKEVIKSLRALAAHPEIKVSYLLGNHDMAMNAKGIDTTKEFIAATFPGVGCLFSQADALGKYGDGNLLAEHGNRYCLFNGPDKVTKPDSFLPLGYFISRLVATVAKEKGKMLMSNPLDYCKAGYYFISNWERKPNFFEDMLDAIARKAGKDSDESIKLMGVPGYRDSMTLSEIGKGFKNAFENWGKNRENIQLSNAFTSELNKFWLAASRQFLGGRKIVIFGHTHEPLIYPEYDRDVYARGINAGTAPDEIPCLRIYANSGGWVDQKYYPGHECTYVESEEVKARDGWRHYVRLKTYPGNILKDERFVVIDK